MGVAGKYAQPAERTEGGEAPYTPLPGRDEGGESLLSPGAWCPLLHHVTAGIVVVDSQGVIRFMNNSAENLLGMASIQTVGKRIDELPLRSLIYRVLSENSSEGAIHLTGNGRHLRIVTRYADIGRKRVELVELVDCSEERHAMKRREEAVAMMTHDLKSPLTVITGYAQAIRGGGDREFVSACADEIEKSARRMLTMIEDMLDAYRMDAGLIFMKRSPCRVGDLLLESCTDYRKEAEAQGILLQYEIPGDLPVISADPRQLSRVFGNLLGNAVKFTPAGGRVFVCASRGEDAIVITITDTGVGIPEQDLERVFQKYYRTSRSAGYRGSGLGLAISRAFVELHGGKIRAMKGEEGGTRMEVVLPLSSTLEDDILPDDAKV